MEIFINRDGEQFGPYTRGMALLYVQNGSLRTEDLCWHEGLSEWQNLGDFLGMRPATQKPPTPPVVALAPAPVVTPLKRVPAAAVASAKAGGGWVNTVMNLVIVGLAIGAGIYFLRSPRGRQLEGIWLPRIVGLVHPAPAAQAVSVPAAVDMAPAPTEPQAAPVAPKEELAASVPVVAEAAPTPASPAPVDWRALSASPGQWPKTVLLKDVVSFPAIFDGRVVGAVKVPAGAAVILVGMNGDQLTVDYRGNRKVISAKDTDIEERLPGRARAAADSPITAVQPSSAFAGPK